MTTAREDTVRLADLLRREHHALAEFLIAIAGFDRERRWVELGYSSLFYFLVRELGLSNGAAQNRKTAAELIQKFPQVEAALREGKLCLSSVNEVAKVITPENAAEVLPRFHGLSARDAAFVAASIRPVQNSPRREFLVTPIRSSAPPTSMAVEACPSVHACEVTSVEPEPAPAPVPSKAPATASPVRERPTVKPLDGQRARVSMTMSRRLLDKLAAARDALSHSHPGASEEAILELGLDLIIERHRKRRGIGAKPRKPKSKPAATAAAAAADPPPSERSRHVPAEVWRAVWERDGGRCAWPLENGGVCGSTRRLELDHIGGFALGAKTNPDECRLLCEWHNDLHARELYGDDLMNRYTQPKGGRCSEPVAAYAPSPSSVTSASTPHARLQEPIMKRLDRRRRTRLLRSALRGRRPQASVEVVRGTSVEEENGAISGRPRQRR